MEIIRRKIKKHQHYNSFGMSYMPINLNKTTFFKHKEGIVGVVFGTFWNNRKEILLYFVKDEFEYIAGIDKFKNERSLALRINMFIKQIKSDL